MKIRFYHLLAVLFTIGLNSCQKEESVSGKRSTSKPGNIVVNNDAQALSKRILRYTDHDLSINDIHGYSSSQLKSTKSVNGILRNYKLQLIAEVPSFSNDGFEMRASHVTVKGNYAFLVYNRENDRYLGGVEIFDITDPYNPQIISQALFPNADVSSVDVTDDLLYMYLASAVNMDEVSGYETPATVGQVALVNKMFTDNLNMVDLKGYVGTDVRVNNGLVYVSSATDGGLSTLNPDKESIDVIEVENARSVEVDNNRVVIMQAEPARLSVFDKAQMNLLNQFDVGGANIPDSKSEVSLYGDLAYVSVGQQGLKVVDLNTGQIVDQQARPIIPSGDTITATDYVTNAVYINDLASINSQLVFVANGAAGLYAYQLNESLKMELVGQVGFLNTNIYSSTNYVEGKNDLIFVATGRGGFKILKIETYTPEDCAYADNSDWDEQGTPTDREHESLCTDDWVPNFKLTLPETTDATKNNASFFEGTHPTEILIEKETEVSIQFVSEGAGYKNVFGCYTYPANNPPTSVDDIQDMTILFANASGQGSGGLLQSGDVVSLKTAVPAGYKMGFFLLADGWKNEVTQGLGAVTTLASINKNKTQQSILFYDETCDRIALAMEDVNLPGGDKDYNDIIFLVNIVEPDAVNTTDYVKISSGLY